MRRLWIPEAPALIRPGREVFLAQPPVRLEGWFEVELIHARTGHTVWQSRFKNLITDGGLDALGASVTPAAASTWLGVGTVGTAPTNGDTGLGGEVERTSSNGGTADVTGFAADNSYSYLRRARLFTTSEANAVLAEVGTFNQDSPGGTLFSRQQIKDSGGVATTITKTSDFELRVTYELRTYIELTDQVYTALVNGVSQNVTVRPGFIGVYSSWTQSATVWPHASADRYHLYSGTLGTITSFPNGTDVAASSVVQAAYAGGSYYRETTATWNAAVANMALTSFMYRLGASAYQHQFSAPVTKLNTQKAELVYRITWGRYP